MLVNLTDIFSTENKVECKEFEIDFSTVTVMGSQYELIEKSPVVLKLRNEGKGQAVEPYVLPEEEKAPEAEQNNNRKNYKNQKPARQPRAPRQPKAPKEEVKVEEAAPAVENSEN